MISLKRKVLDILGIVLVALVAGGFFIPVQTKTGLASPCDVYSNCNGNSLVCKTAPKQLPPAQKSYRYNWLFGQGGKYNRQVKKLAPAKAASCGGVVVRLRLYII